MYSIAQIYDIEIHIYLQQWRIHQPFGNIIQAEENTYRTGKCYIDRFV